MNRRSTILAAFFAFLLFGIGFEAKAGGLQIGASAENFTLPDLNGENRTFNELKGEKGTVVIWLSAQCPVVKAYDTRINQIADEYQAKGINFIGINSNSTESLEWIKSESEKVGYKFPTLIDKGNVLADKFGATVTPEIFFFNEKNVLVYHGSIDNDRSGENITNNYLRDAFNSTLAGKAVAKATSKAFGCTIKRVKNEKQ